MSLVSILDNDIDEILKDIISNMEINICVSSTEVIDAQSFKLFTCNTQYLRPCSLITVNNVEYEVIDFVQDEWLLLQGTPVITDCFTIPNPYYLTGTPMMTSTELKQLGSNISRSPFAWLLEVFDTDYSPNSDNPQGSISRLRLFLFDHAKSEEWLNSDHRTNVIRPMKSLGDNILEAIQKDKRVIELENYKVIDRPNFGNYAQNRGNVKSILPEKLSGIEIIVEIPIFVQENCNKKSKCK